MMWDGEQKKILSSGKGEVSGTLYTRSGSFSLAHLLVEFPTHGTQDMTFDCQRPIGSTSWEGALPLGAGGSPGVGLDRV